ncbi:MAG: beta-N-acetylhexosaminidase [Rhizobiaceae bacterium]|nr:beta-N-acetylhexosaminidase [Rhizobiaceae bacterium]
MRISPVIFGCKSTRLSDEEKAFYRAVQPWGFIVFSRNVETPDQLTALVEELKSCVDHEEVAVLVDQEGGRVRRLRPPHWPEYHSARVIGDHYCENPERGRRIAWLQSRLMAFDLVKLGINVDCLPVLDVPVPGAHDVIGDRAYASSVSPISDMGREAAQGMLDGGVLPVIKHIPGHGRSMVDSHLDLPRVETDLDTLKQTDFEPFKLLADMPVAMTAHVIYEAIDASAPATTSKPVIDGIIRDYIGFDGLLMCDDLSMKALSGDFSQRVQSSFAAGCDVVLHCNGEMDEMRQVADALPEFGNEAFKRVQRATQYWAASGADDESALRDEFERLCRSSEYKSDPTEAHL